MNCKLRFAKNTVVLRPLPFILLFFSPTRTTAQTPLPPSRVIEVVADHDSRYRIAGQKRAEITVKAGEELTLRITATKAKNVNREGSIHGFTLLRAKDRTSVDGWDFPLKPGTQEFSVRAPEVPGEYLVVCTVICSEDHEGMTMRFVVLP